MPSSFVIVSVISIPSQKVKSALSIVAEGEKCKFLLSLCFLEKRKKSDFVVKSDFPFY